MKTSLLMLLLLVVILAGGLLVSESPAPRPESSASAASAAAVPGSSAGAPARETADLQEIRAVVDSARAVEARLMADLGDAASPDHPSVQQLRLETTIRLLEIQARQAADRGQYGLEGRIRANLADLRAGRSFVRAAGPKLARLAR